MSLLLPVVFGLAPSLIWLAYFLRKDVHPESNRMVIKVFLLGVLAAVIAAIVEVGLYKGVANLPFFENHPLVWTLLYNFFGIALVEEFCKLLVVKQWALKDPEFDELFDAMLYMIIAALGFAAMENFLLLLSDHPLLLIGAAQTSSFRFIGATFLHALASGTLGYFLSFSYLKTKHQYALVFLGLVIATALHGLYNFSILETAQDTPFATLFVVIPVAILVALTFFVAFGLRNLRKTSAENPLPHPKQLTH